MSEILKSKGEVIKAVNNITDDELALINTYTRREYNADELYVFNVVLCDNEIDRDYEAFSVNAVRYFSTFSYNSAISSDISSYIELSKIVSSVLDFSSNFPFSNTNLS